MKQQGVLIRGTTEGITIYLDEQGEFAQILQDIEEKFVAANDFFKGASISIHAGNRTISPEEKMALIDLCQEFELAGVEFVNRSLSTAQKRVKDPLVQEGQTLILKKTIRSGQKISYDGNVVIIGDVNPGAQVIALGDIIVMGNLRGVVHAGAQGNTESQVFALSLESTQLRIAHCIARSPDGGNLFKKGSVEPEKAFIKDGLIMIESIEE